MRRCLVVDDSRVIRKVARRILEDMRFEIEEAADGLEALQACRRHMPDAILLDWTMPVMSGEETFTALREIRPDGSMVVSSGYNEHEAARRFAGRDLGGFLQKPYSAATLLQCVRKSLNGGGSGGA